MKIFLFFFCVLISKIAFAQNSYFPHDTSYSINSTAQKIQKKYPNVTPVFANLPKQVQAFPNLVYLELAQERKLYLDIFKPKKNVCKKCPAVLMIHGGGWLAGSKENLIPMAQQLAKKGFVAVTVEYRLGGEAVYPAAVCDLKAAVRWLRKNAEKYDIDTNKIAAYGCSAGAQLATLLGATNGLSLFDEHTQNLSYSADIQAVLNIDGIVSFVHSEAKPEWTGRSANVWLGDYSEHNEHWKAASPLEYANKNTPPILFVNSAFPRFHAGRDDFIFILNQNKIYNEVHTFEDALHSFWLVEPWFEPTLKYSVKFLKSVF